MKLLALDSATDACSAALYLDGEVAERFEIAPRRHTQLLLPMAYQLLAEAGVSLKALDLLAFAQGPGSFTGLRIAVGAIQGLAMGLDRPVLGISTLKALAWRSQRLRQARRVAVAMDARMNQVYWGQYDLDDAGQCHAVVDDCLLDPEALTPLSGEHWQAAGSGWQRFAGLAERCAISVNPADIECYPHAEDVAWLAATQSQPGVAVVAHQVRPVYLRDHVAEKMKARLS